MAQRKDGQGIQRRKISFHLFRVYVKSTVSKHTTKDYSEWLLGHSGSTYWNVEEDDTKELLKCMKYLTFLDYEVPETMGADFESKLEEYESQIGEYQFNAIHDHELIKQLQAELKEIAKKQKLLT